VLVGKTPLPARRESLLEPLRALRHRGLLTMGLTALCYNWAFFTVLGYAPFPMNLNTHQLGYVFTGWGALVAAGAVFIAPRLERSLGVARTLYINLSLFALDVLVIAVGISSKPTLIIAVIVSGLFIGINNTVTTQAVMTVAPVERPVASAAYGFIRFIGAGLAPYAAGRMAASFGVHVPFYVGAGAVLVGIAILASGHRFLTAAEQATTGHAATGHATTRHAATGQGATGQGTTGQGTTGQPSIQAAQPAVPAAQQPPA
jgi:predicted MFS family arabinose efflux permease